MAVSITDIADRPIIDIESLPLNKNFFTTYKIPNVPKRMKKGAIFVILRFGPRSAQINEKRMKPKIILIGTFAFALAACTNEPTKPPTDMAMPVTPSVAVSPQLPMNGDFPATGAITKINRELGSVELDHDDIPGLMPPMRMEFYVTDKKMLDGLKVGDRVDFTLRYKDRAETVVAISKSK